MASRSSILAWKRPLGQSRLVVYSLWDCKESDTTEAVEHMTAQKEPPVF